MRELQNILAALAALRANGETGVLATVVRVSGSTYRRAGARMLISELGRQVGSISGGCLERDLIRKAREVMASGKSLLVSYDSRIDVGDDVADDIYAFGCNGMVEVFLEPLAMTTMSIEFLVSCLCERKPGVLATVFSGRGDLKDSVGGHVMLRDGRDVQSVGIQHARLQAFISQSASEVLQTGKSKNLVFDTEEGRADILLEAVHPPLALIIFGAGDDAIPLSRYAKSLGWHVTVLDPRPGKATRDRFPHVDLAMTSHWPAVAAGHRLTADGASIVVMNHSFAEDAAALNAVFGHKPAYIGLLGPKHRRDRLLAHLHQERTAIRLHAPIGLDIGADSPDEVALAIVSEILAANRGCQGGMARDKLGPLHERDATEQAAPVTDTATILACDAG